MAYATPPTFADDAVLSATQLNILTGNDVYFQSILGSNSNTGFMTEDIAVDSVSATWVFKRSRRYLHYRVDLLTGDSDRLKIFVNAGEELNDGTNRSGAYIWQGYFDLTAITNPVIVGDFYNVYCDIVFVSGSIRVVYFIESDNTSL